MKIGNMLCMFMLLANTAIILAMEDHNVLLPPLKLQNISKTLTTASRCAGMYNLSHYFTDEILTVLSQCDDKNIQSKAYAAAINNNDDNALEKLEKAKIPVPDKNMLSFMMQQYALPRTIILSGNFCKTIPETPKPNAIRWCLEHMADANGVDLGDGYPINDLNGAYGVQLNNTQNVPVCGPLHPLKHVTEYLEFSDYRPTLQLLKNHGASLDPDPKKECTALIQHALNAPLHVLFTSTESEYENYAKMCRIYAILEAYNGVVLDDNTIQDIKTLIHKGSNHTGSSARGTRLQAIALKNQLKLHTTEGIAAQEHRHRRTAFFKSLFSCGRSAQQVTPQSNKEK